MFKYYFECPNCGLKLTLETDDYKNINRKCSSCGTILKRKKIKKIKGV